MMMTLFRIWCEVSLAIFIGFLLLDRFVHRLMLYLSKRLSKIGRESDGKSEFSIFRLIFNFADAVVLKYAKSSDPSDPLDIRKWILTLAQNLVVSVICIYSLLFEFHFQILVVAPGGEGGAVSVHWNLAQASLLGITKNRGDGEAASGPSFAPAAFLATSVVFGHALYDLVYWFVSRFRFKQSPDWSLLVHHLVIYASFPLFVYFDAAIYVLLLQILHELSSPLISLRCVMLICGFSNAPRISAKEEAAADDSNYLLWVWGVRGGEGERRALNFAWLIPRLKS